MWVVLTALLWLLVTALCWVGYTGEDDLFYARYAYLFHRPPIVWWEFRMPAILAIRGSFLVFGPTEFAAAFPSLVASLAIMASVAWIVGWPRTLTWQSQSAMVLAALIPIDVSFRSYPSANQIAAGLMALGSVCMLKGGRRVPVIGAALLALAFMTHEISFFYVALFCATLLAFDWRRFFRPVVWCVALSGALAVAEAATYAVVLHDPLARWKTSAATTTTVEIGSDPDVGIQGVRFFLWPIQNLIISKQFGIDLLVLLVAGTVAWRRLTRDHKALLVATFAVFLWFGYGSQVPWAYKPLYREYHYYNCLTLGIVALLPLAVGFALSHRPRLAQSIVGAAIAVHVLSLAATGRWGANVKVSRELLQYAQSHPDQHFVTDVNTMNQMYTLNAFRLPDNIVCLNGEAVQRHLLLNKEPPDVPRFRFPERRVDAALVNREQGNLRGFEREFSGFVQERGGDHTAVAQQRYRPAFVPLIRLLGPRGFMVQSAGGDVIAIAETRTPQVASVAGR